ncbi:Trk-type K+ transport system, membrane component [Methylocaldum marinum]|uniref:Trk system potassium uptake protein n=1 Tax=Methylocaldum marinum TaxID=1432792 RepID=A0A250KZU4_9GAMM|nr:potassium transporter TrkG [Methylocaldum marinum]BBA37198.1 Trk-type K+ transport system, membrane component [Methylocaldum marinum]
MYRFLSLARVFGLMLMVFSVTYAFPILASLVYGDGTLSLFIQDMLLTLAAGGLLWLTTRKFRRELKAKDGFLLVVLAWIGMAAFATLPLKSYLEDLSFTDAYFEAMSGLTTSGATVLTGLDDLPPAINLWRHELNWLGGMGIIVLVVAILPVLGVGGRQLFMAETPGPMKESKLTPRITETAKNLWLVYAGLTIACIVSLKLAGMNWLDAICHAFSAVGLGGFSTHDASIGYFDSPQIEGVLTFFMLLAGMNFATHFLAIRSRTFTPYKHDIELAPFLILILASCVGIAFYLWQEHTYPDFWTALRHTTFNLVSLATDCGYAGTDFNQWPLFAPLWMLFLGCITACTGSTGGGIKLMRTLILVKQSQLQMLLLTHPTAVNPLKLGTMVIPSGIILAVLGFIFVYFMSIVILVLLLIISGLDVVSALSAAIACINNMGPGLGEVGPAANYAGLTDFQTWLCTLAMFLGRIEVFTALILFTPAYWRK